MNAFTETCHALDWQWLDRICRQLGHIVPKYEGGFGFGGTFEMNPQKVYLSDADYAETIAKIVSAL